MARLIVLNGPPASGKSTIARLYVADHPLALNLDIDRIRALLGDWQARPIDAGLRAREIALAAARVQLGAGGDVVVPQFLGRPDLLDRLEALAAETGAEYHELVLRLGKDEAVRRFDQRTRDSADPADRDAAEMIADDPGWLSAAHDALEKLVATRPHARYVDSETGDPERTYDLVLRAIASR